MILDHIHDHAACTALHPLFAKAFGHLLELAGRSDLPPGRIELEGEQIYAVIVDGHGKTKAGARTETHRRYIDIQYTAAGSDLIGWMPSAQCRESSGYDEVKDVELYLDVPSHWIAIPAGHFAIFLPHDAHAPMANEGEPISKIVIKVAV